MSAQKGESEAARNASYDDRLDVETNLSAGDVLGILARSLAYIKPAWRLFALKFLLMMVSFAPIVVAPLALKVLTDHVLLENPLAEATIDFPPFFQPFVDATVHLPPTGLLFATLALLLALLLLFGAGIGEAEGTAAFLAQGEDTATQSENMISAGWSLAGGVWGLADLLCNIRLVQRVTNGLRTHLFGRLTRLPMTVLDDQRIGDGIYRTMYDAPAIQGICFDLTLMPVVSLLGTAASVYVINYSFGDKVPELVWLAMATLPLTLLFTIPLAGVARRTSQASRGAGSATTNRIEENMANVAAVQSHNAGEREKDAFGEASRESYRRFRHMVVVNIGIELLSGLALLVVGVWAFLLISDRIIAGDLLPGDFVLALGLFFAVAGASLTLGRLWVDFQGNAAGVRRVFFYLDLPSDGSTAPTSGSQRAAQVNSVVFEGVGLTYPDGREALREISFRANAGELVAIAGPTGAGKTSLAYMIPGFLTPTSGRVLIGGVDTREWPLADLRNAASYVFQEHLFLSGTIMENLRLGRPDASREEVEKAARLSGAHDFIADLPQGYETVLGRDGGSLSVGEKQRISIARGLVRDTPLLILDEPTAALDPETEQALVAALTSPAAQERGIRSPNRIVFVIAHRLSTISRADRILFMRDGRIVEQGSHAELLAREGGEYRDFVRLQSVG